MVLQMICNHKHEKSESLEDRIRGSGLKLTPSRLRVLELLEAKRCLMTVDEVVSALTRRTKKKADWTTIYRTLLSFSDAGIVTSTLLDDGVARYEYKCLAPGDTHHHHHIQCKSCGKISPIEACEIQTIEAMIARMGYSDLSHKLEFTGVCPDCRDR
jgi:Fur family ferric uptake transcriptional regulator